MHIIGDLASVATAVGVLLAAWGLRVQARQRKISLTQLYVKRFWELDDAVRLAKADGAPLSVHHERYLRLCEDEYEIARLGWIELKVWDVWHEGIQIGVSKLSVEPTDLQLLQRCRRQGSDHRGHQCEILSDASAPRKAMWWVERRLGTW
jgi:hypothetical protein